MKIDVVELYRVAIPLRGTRPLFCWPASHGGSVRPDRFYPSWIPGFPQTEMRLYLLRLIASNGAEGIAATPAMGTERDGLGPMFGSYLLGLDPEDRDAVNARIEEFSYLGLRNGWIESAFLDIAAKSAGVPLWKLLGGTGGNVRPYWSTGTTYDHDPQAARGLVQAAIDQGFGAVKLRVKSSDLARITAFLAAARDEAGGLQARRIHGPTEYDRRGASSRRSEEGASSPAVTDERRTDAQQIGGQTTEAHELSGLQLMVDCNQGWPVSIVHRVPRWSRAFAGQVAREADGLGFHWIEEPLHRGDAAGLAELRAGLKSLRVAGGELNASLAEYDEYLRLGSLDVYQPDAILAEGTFSGGITLVQKLLERLRQAGGLSYCPHTWTTGVGFLVNLHLMGLLPAEERHFIEFPIEGPWTPESWGAILATPPARDRTGAIALPTQPGLGAEIDWARVRRHGRRLHRATPLRVAYSTIRDRGPRVTMELMRERGRAG